MPPKTSIPEAIWPPVSGPRATMLLALLYQLEQSQWWSSRNILAQQFRQLNELVDHAERTVPYYHQIRRKAGLAPQEPITAENWQAIPLLTPAALIKHAGQMASTAIPPGHGRITGLKSSGSTGHAVSVLATGATGLIWQALNLRDHLWQARDVSKRLVTIRSGRYVKEPGVLYEFPGWGIATDLVFQTGPSALFHNLTALERQAEFLQKLKPDYLFAFPGIILRLAHYFRRHQLRLPGLKQVLTFGEPTSPEIESLCREVWDTECRDMYSAEEAGCIALQCPQTDNYHVQSESLLVEVLDDKGDPCEPGEIGRVILTTLHNFAMPLIRYQIGDYAEAGGPCPCGRGLPTLKRILGRRRNRARLPDGRRIWPQLSSESWSDIKEIECIQIRQKTLDRLDIGVVSPHPLNLSDETRLTGSLHQVFGYPFACIFSCLDAIPCHVNGKFEPFISELDDNRDE